MPVLRLLAVAAMIAVAACSNGTGSNPPPPPPPPPPPGPPPPPPPPPPGTATIQVQDNQFSPAVDTVASAGTVTWNWSGINPHNVTFEDSATYNSGDQTGTGTHSRTFGAATVATTYRFRCTVHSTSFTSGMTGRIVVRP
jgi:plastocyanin